MQTQTITLTLCDTCRQKMAGALLNRQNLPNPKPAPQPQAPLQPPAPESVLICYTNYKNEVKIYRILPKQIWFGHTDYHPIDQWLLDAVDVDRQCERTFALKDIHKWVV